MSADIRKFIQNSKKLESILGDIKITRWTLLVPFFDSRELVAHAAKKTQEVLAANLPYVDHKNFRVFIEDEESFAIERDSLIHADLNKIEILPVPLSDSELSDWADENDELVGSADQKIARMPTLHTDAERREFRNEVVKHHREGQNILEELRKYPSAYEAIRKAKSEKRMREIPQDEISAGPGDTF